MLSVFIVNKTPAIGMKYFRKPGMYRTEMHDVT